MAMTDLMSLTLGEVSGLIKTRKLSPVELTQASLRTIDDLDHKLNSFLTVCHESALATASKAEKQILAGSHIGPFHGIPYAVKDIYATKGIKTTNGAKVFASSVPSYNCTAVRKLIRSGGVLIGKNHCLEFACGNHHSLYGEVRNPWNLEYSPGGSSSGSGASVAACMVFGSMGSCTGGSIRGPASHCNIVGLKPSYGLVSRYGVFPLSWSLDHAGPMTRTVMDCAIMLQTVAGYDSKDPSSARVSIPDYSEILDGNIKGLRVGVPVELNENTPEPVSSLINNAIKTLSELGASIEEVSLPITGEYATVSGNIITWSEEAQVHAPWLDQLHEYTPGARQKVLVGSVIPSAQYHKAQQMRRMVIEEINQSLQKVDVLVGPVQKTPPGPLPGKSGGPEIAGALNMASERSLSRPYNLTGMPAISVPCGFSPDGLPVGLQIAGRLFEDSIVLKVAHAYEQASPWHTMHPSF